jgi:hypothetical protein
MTYAWASPLGYLDGDQEALMPMLDRGIEAIVRGVLIDEDGSEVKAVSALLYWLDNGPVSGRIDIDFPRKRELQAVMVLEVIKRYQRFNNQRVIEQAIADGFMGVAV